MKASNLDVGAINQHTLLLEVREVGACQEFAHLDWVSGMLGAVVRVNDA